MDTHGCVDAADVWCPACTRLEQKGESKDKGDSEEEDSDGCRKEE